MMLAVLVVGLWLARQVKLARDQREAVTAIERLGGTVGYRPTSLSRRLANGPMREFARWLRRIAGDDLFCTVERVYSSGDMTAHTSELSDEQLVHVERLPGLELLYLLEQFDATDERLARLRRLGDLVGLFVWNAEEVTDLGAAHLATLTSLKSLEVWESKITDEGLARLATLPRLETLELTSDWITDAGLARMKGMKALRLLSLTGSRITDEGLMQLAGLANLRQLSISQTAVSQAGILRFHATRPKVLITWSTRDAPAKAAARRTVAGGGSASVGQAVFDAARTSP